MAVQERAPAGRFFTSVETEAAAGPRNKLMQGGIAMDDDRIVDLARKRAESASQRRKAAVARLKPAPWMVAWAVFLGIAVVGFFWSGASNTFQKASPTGVIDYSAAIAACGWIRRTCLVDGDTGWQDGVKWRLLDVDAPESAAAECARERELAGKSLDRLGALMAGGYKIAWSGKKDRYGRELVGITLSDGKDAGAMLIAEGLAQAWPNTGNVWCS
jgi:micrococcal nuclease